MLNHNVCAGHPLVRVGLIYLVFKAASLLLHLPVLWNHVQRFTYFMTGTAPKEEL